MTDPARAPMTPKDVVKAFHAAFVARDVEALCALYADDAVNHQVAEEPLRGKAAIRKGFEAFFRAFAASSTCATASSSSSGATGTS